MENIIILDTYIYLSIKQAIIEKKLIISKQYFIECNLKHETFLSRDTIKIKNLYVIYYYDMKVTHPI